MIYKVIGILFIILSLIIGWGWMDYQSSLHDSVISDEAIVFEINKGDTFNKITRNLINKKVTIKPFWFKFIALQNNVLNKLKAGEYELSSGLTSLDLLTVFTEGKTLQYSITFPEGWTFKQIKTAIKENPYLIHTIDDMNEREILSKLGAEKTHPEGLFFPDTYYFDKHTSDLDLLQRAYVKMQQTLAKLWGNREQGLPLKDAYQALILASIVEKETANPAERAMIAGVFIRRMRLRMLLQTDPTVIYGMGENYKGNIRVKDLKTPTPYNTYTIKGLPPTPIAMPGKAAIHSVLHPQKGKSIYFVSKGNGSHIFSATLAEHNQAVKLYQLKGK